MENVQQLVQDTARRKRIVMILALVAVLLAVGLAPRNQRALFMSAGIVDALPQAFAASPFHSVVFGWPAGGYGGGNPNGFGRPNPNAFLARTPNPGTGYNQPTGPANEGIFPPTPFGPLTFGDTPIPDTGFPIWPDSGIIPPNLPDTINPPGFIPTVGGQLPPVGAVPEPATWLTMILGMFAVGVALRRRTGLEALDAEFSERGADCPQS